MGQLAPSCVQNRPVDLQKLRRQNAHRFLHHRAQRHPPDLGPSRKSPFPGSPSIVGSTALAGLAVAHLGAIRTRPLRLKLALAPLSPKFTSPPSPFHLPA